MYDRGTLISTESEGTAETGIEVQRAEQPDASVAGPSNVLFTSVRNKNDM